MLYLQNHTARRLNSWFLAAVAALFVVGAAASRAHAQHGPLVSWDTGGVVSGTPAGAFTAVAAEDWHFVAIRTDGALVSWGGDDFIDDVFGEVSGPNADGGTFTAVAAGPYYSVAIRTDGTLVSWGI